MNLKKLSIITGYFFVIIGILGYIPGITEQGYLLGLFRVNSITNFIHILTGLIAYGASRKNPKIIKFFFQIIGVIYTALALFGFYHVDQQMFGFIANNLGHSWLHLILGISFLYIGFLYKKS